MIGQEDFIVDLLVSRGLVTENQVEDAKKRVQEESVDSVLAGLYATDAVSDKAVLKMLAEEYGMETFDFDVQKGRLPEHIIQLIPAQIAMRYHMIPIAYNGETLKVAMADPADIESLDAVRHLTKMDVEGVLVTEKQLLHFLDFYYKRSDAGDILTEMTETTTDVTVSATTDSTTDATTDATTDSSVGGGDAESAPIIRYVSLLILEAFRSRASDIHLEPMEKRFRVRYRIDGVLNEMDAPPKYLQNKILSRLKLMSGMDLSEHRIPQDGRIRITAMGRELDLRVSDIPCTYGESIVMRILDKSGVMLGISELGFMEDDTKLIYKILNLPDGIFLVTGPTGSGKTTSLYSFLHELNQPTRKIITAEDPVEYELSGINQVQVNTDVGLTFGSALRAMLRQAPNIIMVGEIRDAETGSIAINAALTGHLVFSTLHTNDAPSAVPRLIDMGIKPFLVASSLRAVMAQRLVRRLCKNCKRPHEVTAAEKEGLGLDDEFLEKATFMEPVGCPDCNKGYRGRMGIYEIFMLDNSLENLIYQRADSGVIKRRAQELGMRDLRDDGVRKAAMGVTSISEVLRLTVQD
ncbi:MAG: Flp pilus assembly complex ATPase component TadA [Lentisphaeria bacterium]|nr:Flp pilus assembly complex ATPase component TadA [Lentisphaeria bacterium]